MFNSPKLTYCQKRNQILAIMEFLESELKATRGKKPRDDARRALLAVSVAALQLAETIKKKLKDRKWKLR